MSSKVVYEVPPSVIEDLSLIKAWVQTIVENERKHLPNEPLDSQWLTADAFLKTIGAKRTWLHLHRHQLNCRKISRKLYIHRDEVGRYFEGAFSK